MKKARPARQQQARSSSQAAGKRRKGAVERPCPFCGHPIHNAPSRRAEDGRQLYAWSNADGSRHICRDFKPRRLLLDVPYEEKDLAKELGARWDGETWWANVSPGDEEKFKRWKSKNPA